MAALIFYFSRQLRNCLLEGREVEQRVVAESAQPARRFQDFSVNAIRNNGHGSSALRYGDRTNEMCLALRSCLAPHFAQPLFDSFRIFGLRPCVPFGSESRRPA